VSKIPIFFLNPIIARWNRCRLRLLDGWPKPGTAVDMGQQRPTRGAQGLDETRGPDHRVGPVSAPHPERRDQGILLLGSRVQ